MTVSAELALLKSNIEDTYRALAAKGATLPELQCANNLSDCVQTLDINDNANVINATNYTGRTLRRGEKVFVTTVNPNSSLEDGGYYIVNFSSIPDDRIYTAVTSDGCSALSKVDVFTVLESNVMTNAENDTFIYDVIVGS